LQRLRFKLCDSGWRRRPDERGSEAESDIALAGAATILVLCLPAVARCLSTHGNSLCRLRVPAGPRALATQSARSRSIPRSVCDSSPCDNCICDPGMCHGDIASQAPYADGSHSIMARGPTKRCLAVRPPSHCASRGVVRSHHRPDSHGPDCTPLLVRRLHAARRNLGGLRHGLTAWLGSAAWRFSQQSGVMVRHGAACPKPMEHQTVDAGVGILGSRPRTGME
jgi:hypothetical protein